MSTEVSAADSKQHDPVDAQTYKNVMRHHAGAVAIVSAGHSGSRTGLTATALCSLSDSPPMVLVCVNRNASGHDIISRAGTFCVNILHGDQGAFAATFAGRSGLQGEDRFRSTDWTTLATGAPVLKDALASLDCELHATHAYDTHSIFVGRVRAVQTAACRSPLIYFNGKFHHLLPEGVLA